MPGCKTPAFTDCKEQAKRQIVETCTKIYPPEPSFSECIRDPPPPIRFTECQDLSEENVQSHIRKNLMMLVNLQKRKNSMSSTKGTRKNEEES
ncbi:hypothetical protein L9F63_006017 [Diploptera punctata]|uniref:Uncharacterized protein n=1 Tax=Diploptera punctata TaxID=6984 RepID=A0AAD8E5D0_DIPPU|nr:hypothetical protein L9F63_006017 [Diploptera punctata]